MAVLASQSHVRGLLINASAPTVFQLEWASLTSHQNIQLLWLKPTSIQTASLKAPPRWKRRSDDDGGDEHATALNILLFTDNSFIQDKQP